MLYCIITFVTGPYHISLAGLEFANVDQASFELKSPCLPSVGIKDECHCTLVCSSP